jgi:hypothetical protein
VKFRPSAVPGCCFAWDLALGRFALTRKVFQRLGLRRASSSTIQSSTRAGRFVVLLVFLPAAKLHPDGDKLLSLRCSAPESALSKLDPLVLFTERLFGVAENAVLIINRQNASNLICLVLCQRLQRGELPVYTDPSCRNRLPSRGWSGFCGL